MSKINIDGTILDSEAQLKLFGYIESYIYGLKRKEAEDIALKEILVSCKDTLDLDTKFVKSAAVNIWKVEAGKIDLQKQNDDAAAIEQCMEIHDTMSGE